MTHQVVAEQLAHRLQHVYQHWEKRRRMAPLPAPASLGGLHAFSIAISREAGTNGTLIAQEVGKRLNWPVYDHQLLERISEDMGIQTKLLETVDEKQVSWLQEAFEAAFAVPRVPELGYVHHLIKTVLALGIHGECVIVGRGAPYILPPAATLRVRLVAPLHDRIATISKDLTMSHEEARRHVEALDAERRHFVLNYFHKDPSDLRHYDLIINTARFSVTTSAGVIAHAARSLQP
jgi:cytidylate kinase